CARYEGAAAGTWFFDYW
nr:immunoglobulin heavy chain junction region [Macaca mulatta]MOX60781.1 immunoglobulin heavy chain junction region [Macaca mulatta]MOX61141.1 immunoglobulin heavy chain junction region [Macaca mulatta]MOX63514.1 immunoglobulin heavy chain junction region [Macaca mulatta]MOX64187.1 immunoglobulin heavy chain junction region [Macaca mulatta]